MQSKTEYKIHKATNGPLDRHEGPRGFMVTETNNVACAQLQLLLTPLLAYAHATIHGTRPLIG